MAATNRILYGGKTSGDKEAVGIMRNRSAGRARPPRTTKVNNYSLGSAVGGATRTKGGTA